MVHVIKRLCVIGLLSFTPLNHAAEYLSGPADYIYSPIVLKSTARRFGMATHLNLMLLNGKTSFNLLRPVNIQ